MGDGNAVCQGSGRAVAILSCCPPAVMGSVGRPAPAAHRANSLPQVPSFQKRLVWGASVGTPAAARALTMGGIWALIRTSTAMSPGDSVLSRTLVCVLPLRRTSCKVWLPLPRSCVTRMAIQSCSA